MKKNVKVKPKDNRPKKLFLVWDDSILQRYNIYSSMNTAVECHSEQEIYQAIPKPIGKYKKVTTLVKIEEKRGPGRPKKVAK